MNDIVSPPQAKIFINGVLKVQNKGIGMILHITILKVLPKDKKEGAVLSPFQRGVVFQLQGVLISATKGGAPPCPPVALV